jgi:hypothetical protein
MSKLYDFLLYRYILMENYFWYRVDDFNDFRKNANWIQKNGVYKDKKDPDA